MQWWYSASFNIRYFTTLVLLPKKQNSLCLLEAIHYMQFICIMVTDLNAWVAYKWKSSYLNTSHVLKCDPFEYILISRFTYAWQHFVFHLLVAGKFSFCYKMHEKLILTSKEMGIEIRVFNWVEYLRYFYPGEKVLVNICMCTFLVPRNYTLVKCNLSWMQCLMF